MKNFFVTIVCCFTVCGISADCLGNKNFATNDKRIRIILDTDTNNELDDQHAIAYLLVNQAVFDIEGLTVNKTGSHPVDSHYEEAKRVIKLCGYGESIKVYKGPNDSYDEIKGTINRADFDGHEAVDFIISRARVKSDRKLVVVAVGKLTTVALALLKAPDIADKIKIIWLGGNWPANRVANEYNLRNDFSAVNPVYNNPKVPLEICIVGGKRDFSGSGNIRIKHQAIYRIMPGLGIHIAPFITGRHGDLFNNFGDYSVNLFSHVKVSTRGRALFDVAPLAILKNPAWGRMKIIGAPYINDKVIAQKAWVFRDNNPRKITYWGSFNRDAIITDFINTLTFSAVNRVFNDIKHVEQLQLTDKNIWAFYLKRKGIASSYAVIYSNRYQATMIVKLPNQSIEFQDMNGNKIKPFKIKAGKAYFSLKEQPMIIVAKADQSGAVVKKMIKTALYRIIPVELSFIIKDRQHGLLMIKNRTAKPLKLKLTGRQRNYVVLAENIVLTSSSKQLIKTKWHANTLSEFVFTVLAGNEYKPVIASFSPQIEQISKRKIKIDGQLKDWNSAPWRLNLSDKIYIAPTHNRKDWHGVADLSATAQFAWDNDNLFISLQVTDDIHLNNKKGRSIWNGDCLQVEVDVKNDAYFAPGNGVNVDDKSWGVALTSTGTKFHTWKGGKQFKLSSRVVIHRDEQAKQTIYEMSIPWSVLGLKTPSGKIIALSFVIFDDDGQGMKKWLQLTPGIAGWKDPRAFKKLLMFE